ncbi:MAG: hypothetical protein A2017_13880 [Lentisphaerae bacterium GWF2_44_16]|nr:MAG: hypothetical protein A2017_13880 [Lentisphaerae bacterium GWF2_44_16]
MKLEMLLDSLFPLGHGCAVNGNVITGYCTAETGKVSLIGAKNSAELDLEMLLRLSEHVLDTVANHPGCPIVMLVDSKGHKMGLQEELLGLNAYLAHLLKTLQLARMRGHHLVTIVYGWGWAGSFIAMGLTSDHIYSLEDAQVGEMTLKAMSRVTKIPLEKLEDLSENSPVFAPSAANFETLGGIDEIWSNDNLARKLAKALSLTDREDKRYELAFERGGRTLSKPVIEKILSEA